MKPAPPVTRKFMNRTARKSSRTDCQSQGCGRMIAKVQAPRPPLVLQRPNQFGATKNLTCRGATPGGSDGPESMDHAIRKSSGAVMEKDCSPFSLCCFAVGNLLPSRYIPSYRDAPTAFGKGAQQTCLKWKCPPPYPAIRG